MMNFELQEAKLILSRTPDVLDSLLTGLPDAWLSNNEGPDTWSPFDVLGHLIHGEKTDWMARAKKCLARGEEKKFESFDRFAQFEESVGKTATDLLERFRELRGANLQFIDDLEIDEEKLKSIGIHPKFGEVTLRQLLSTWAAHDLNHIVQICRVMARQYHEEVGPCKQYMRVMQDVVPYEK